MAKLSIEDLLNYNRQGLIPGPSEEEEAFAARVHYCLDLHRTLPQALDKEVSFDADASAAIIYSAASRMQPLYDILPTWIPLLFSGHRLSWWHGGCAWIFQLTDETPTGAFLQLRPAFKKAKRYLGLYDREELIAHESAHVGRMCFEEPKFEEVLAYRSASSAFRRWFGPIAQSPWESLAFVAVVVISLLLDFALLFLHKVELYSITWGAKALLAAMLVYGFGRAYWRQQQLKRCLKVLQLLLHDANKANAVAYRLQDKEIISFGSCTPAEVMSYAQTQAHTSLRWHVLHRTYFSFS